MDIACDYELGALQSAKRLVFFLWHDGFGGLVVSMRVQTRPKPLDFYCRKNPQHAFLRRGSKRICPMSQLCGM